MNEDPFEARVSRLSDYLIRAFKYDKPSILFALYLSEFFRADIENALKKHLKEQGLEAVGVDAGKNKDLPSFFSLKNSRNVVFLAYGLEKGFPEVLNYLNFKREDLIEHKVKVVFWVTEKELSRISLEAPDFFAFRNRVVEFMELPLTEDRRPALIQFAMETEYKSLDAIRGSIDLKEKLLSELSGDDEISGYLLGSLGILYDQIGSYKKAIEYYEKALAISHEMGDRRGEGNHLGNLGSAYSDLGQVEKAIEYYEKALAIFKEIGDRRGEGIGLGKLGNAYSDLGQLEKAIEYQEQALLIAQEIGDERGEGVDLGNLGITYSQLGQLEKAIEYYEKALVISQEIADRRNEGAWLGNLGLAYSDLGQLEKAIEYYEKALAISQEIGDKRSEGNHLGNLGSAYSDLGQVEKAIGYHEKALAISQEIGDRRSEGAGLNNLGVAFENTKNYEEALACFLRAKAIRTDIKDPNLKTTEANIKELKEKLGEKEFKKLETEVTPKAGEIVKALLNKK